MTEEPKQAQLAEPVVEKMRLCMYCACPESGAEIHPCPHPKGHVWVPMHGGKQPAEPPADVSEARKQAIESGLRWLDDFDASPVPLSQDRIRTAAIGYGFDAALARSRASAAEELSAFARDVEARYGETHSLLVREIFTLMRAVLRERTEGRR